MTTQKQLILIDGSSYLYRAFHALPPLTNSQGEPTGATYGVINMIRKLLADYPDSPVVVIFDPPGKTYRDTIYTEYKAHRPPMMDELSAQVPAIHSIIKAMGLPLLMIQGEEADDVIGTLTKQAEKQGWKVLISTGDKDMAQLVNQNVTLINTMSNTLLDESGVFSKFGVKPKQIIDYLALMGDTSDNIPGVAKVGPKTAAKWIAQYDTLENVMANAGKIAGVVGENLRASLQILPLSKRLVTIRTDLALPIKVDDLHQSEMDVAALTEWFKRLEFRSWLTELIEKKSASKSKNQSYQLINTEAQLKQLEKHLRQHKLFAFDTETTDLNIIDAKIVGVSFAYQAQEAFYIPVGHDYPGAPVQLPKPVVMEFLQQLFADKTLTVIGQNIKYDLNVLLNEGITVHSQLIDTMLESYVLNSTSNRHDMDSLALKHLAQRTITFEDIAGKGSKQLTFNQIEIDKALPYACQDADVTWQLHETFFPQLKKNPKLLDIFTDIEMPLIPVLAEMEKYGVLVDVEKLKKLSQQFGERIKTLENQAHQLAKKVFNLSSPKQLQEILFQDLKLPVLGKTPTGQPSTGEEVLEELAHDYPLPKVILEYRSLTKLKSTYADGLVAEMNPQTGRVHTSYNQAVTSTGRLSSTDPNLQNIPIRTEEGRKIRQTFIAPKGYRIVSADYSQIELRIMAHLSQDQGLLKAFQNGEDIHAATASEVFDVDLNKVTTEQRRHAKAINFGLIYGMSAFGLARQIAVAREVAQLYMDLYFQRYPGVQEYMNKTRMVAHKQGYVETVFGRRLYLPEINASNMQRRRAAERAAINAPMQGTAADIIKLAMCHLQAKIQQKKLPMRMIMQVHDELVFEVEEDKVEVIKPIIREAMINVVKLATPLEVEIGAGENWDEAH